MKIFMLLWAFSVTLPAQVGRGTSEYYGSISLSPGETKVEVLPGDPGGFILSLSPSTSDMNFSAQLDGPALVTPTNVSGGEKWFSVDPGPGGDYRVTVMNTGSSPAKVIYQMVLSSETFMAVVPSKPRFVLGDSLTAGVVIESATNATVTAWCVSSAGNLGANLDLLATAEGLPPDTKQYWLTCPTLVLGEVFILVVAEGVTSTNQKFRRNTYARTTVVDSTPFAEFDHCTDVPKYGKIGSVRCSLMVNRDKQVNSSIVFILTGGDDPEKVCYIRTDGLMKPGRLPYDADLPSTQLRDCVSKVGGESKSALLHIIGISISEQTGRGFAFSQVVDYLLRTTPYRQEEFYNGE